MGEGLTQSYELKEKKETLEWGECMKGLNQDFRIIKK